MGNPGAKAVIYLVELIVARLLIQNGTNVLRAKATATLMQVVLELWSVEETTAGVTITWMFIIRMTAVQPPKNKGERRRIVYLKHN